MATYDNCRKCIKGLECGWSNIEPDEEIDTTQMTDEPCENLCEPSVFTVDNVDTEGLCRVFEAAAVREINDKCPMSGRKGRIRNSTWRKGGRR